MTQVIRPKVLNLDKPWSLILIQSYIEGWNWKNKIQLYQRIKKWAIKKIGIKIKIQNKFYIWYWKEKSI